MLLTQLLYTWECLRAAKYSPAFTSILQCKVSVTFVNLNYLCQRAPNLSILVEKTKKNSELMQIIMQEQSSKEICTRTHASASSLFLTNKEQNGRDHSRVNQSKTINKPPMSLQLKVIQNEKKNTLKLNSSPSFIHSIKKRKEKKKHNQILLTQAYHVLMQDICF